MIVSRRSDSPIVLCADVPKLLDQGYNVFLRFNFKRKLTDTEVTAAVKKPEKKDA